MSIKVPNNKWIFSTDLLTVTLNLNGKEEHIGKLCEYIASNDMNSDATMLHLEDWAGHRNIPCKVRIKIWKPTGLKLALIRRLARFCAKHVTHPIQPLRRTK